MKFEDIIIKTSDTMKLRGFTQDSQKTYLNCISKYLKFISNNSMKLGVESAKEYLLRLNIRGKDSNTIKVHSACIRFLFIDVLNLKVGKFAIPSPKRKKELPFVLSINEVNSIISSIDNKTHNLIISFLYSTGIRLSELINMRRCDIHFDRGQVFVKAGKGQKDRFTLLSNNLKDRLGDHIANFDFKTEFLFESNRGTKYTKATIQKIVSQKSKHITNKVTPHTFRHSFATHLLESGTDVRIIQKLLGHAKLDTTMIYTKVANNTLINIISPFDKL